MRCRFDHGATEPLQVVFQQAGFAGFEALRSGIDRLLAIIEDWGIPTACGVEKGRDPVLAELVEKALDDGAEVA